MTLTNKKKNPNHNNPTISIKHPHPRKSPLQEYPNITHSDDTFQQFSIHSIFNEVSQYTIMGPSVNNSFQRTYYR